MRDKTYKDNSSLGFMVAGVKTMLQQPSVQGFYTEMEALGYFGRLDPTIAPEVMRNAIITSGELKQLCTLDNIVRLGRVNAVHDQHIELEQGQIKLKPNTLLVDCTASATNNYHGSYQVFGPTRIRLTLWLAYGQPSHSAACIGYLEANFGSDAYKNAICDPATLYGPKDYSGRLTNVIDMLWADMMTQRACQKDKLLAKFYLYARTNSTSPTHCSLLITMWTLFGPTRLNSQIGHLINKIEHVGFVDYPPKKPYDKDRLTVMQWFEQIFRAFKLSLLSAVGAQPSRVVSL